jgi:hypothetical protein
VGIAVLALAGAFAFASADRCGTWPNEGPQVGLVGRGAGELSVGAAVTAVEIPGTVTVGGYAPFRTSATSGDPITARATYVTVGGARLAVISLEVLLLTQPLVAKIREGHDFPVLVTATHTHSSVGQFDRRLAAQLGALGSFDEDVEVALVTAARRSLDEARKQVKPASMQVRSFSTADLIVARSGDAADPRGLEVRFAQPDGATIARWLLLAAHPTLAPQRGTTFDTDWPGSVAGTFDGVTTVLQTSVGNVSVNKDSMGTDVAFASALRPRAEQGALLEGCDGTTLSVASARVDLPHPDGARLVPAPLTGLVENALCAAEEMDVEVMMVRLGCLSLLALPTEPTFATSAALEKLTGATRLLALSNGYVGYLEPADVVRAGAGEARRQWFGPELFERMASVGLLLAMTTDLGGPRVPGQ